MIFVFGSNLAGYHGKGAAHDAYLQHGARMGVGEGHEGNSYAVPTKDKHLRSRSLYDIRKSVYKFIEYAVAHPDLQFQVTRIGCGYAGYKDHQIGPMFARAPSNCHLPDEWLQYRKG